MTFIYLAKTFLNLSWKKMDIPFFSPSNKWNIFFYFCVKSCGVYINKTSVKRSSFWNNVSRYKQRNYYYMKNIFLICLLYKLQIYIYIYIYIHLLAKLYIYFFKLQIKIFIIYFCEFGYSSEFLFFFGNSLRHLAFRFFYLI